MTATAKTGRIMAVLFAGVLLGAMDIAIVGPAMPLIKSQFSVNDRDLSWIFTIYILFNLIGTPLMARLSDLLGRKAVYTVSIAFFALGSAAVASAGSFAFILAARGLQGLAAGGFMPVASAVIGDVYPPEKRGRALGLIGMVFGLAFIIGPIIGGVILPYGWRLLFWVNVPLAILVGAGSVLLLPGRVPGRKGHFDLAGMALLAAVLASFAWGVNRIDTSRFLASLLTPGSGLLLLAAILLAIPLVLVERRTAWPVAPLRLLSSRRLVAASLISFGSGMAEASLVYVAQLAVFAFGASPASASFLMLPLVGAMTLGSPLAGRLLDKMGPRSVIGSGAALMAAGMVALGLSGRSMGLFIGGQVLVGLGLSAMLGAPIRYIFLDESGKDDRSAAQALVNLESSAGMLLGGASIGAVAASSGGGASGIRMAYLVLAGLSVLMFLLTPLLGKVHKAEAAGPDAAKGGE
jgi:MFS family permease